MNNPYREESKELRFYFLGLSLGLTFATEGEITAFLNEHVRRWFRHLPTPSDYRFYFLASYLSGSKLHRLIADQWPRADFTLVEVERPISIHGNTAATRYMLQEVADEKKD